MPSMGRREGVRNAGEGLPIGTGCMFSRAVVCKQFWRCNPFPRWFLLPKSNIENRPNGETELSEEGLGPVPARLPSPCAEDLSLL